MYAGCREHGNEPASLSGFALYITVSVCCSLLTSLGKYTQPLEASVGAAQETQARVVVAWGQTSRKAPSASPERKQVELLEALVLPVLLTLLVLLLPY